MTIIITNLIEKYYIWLIISVMEQVVELDKAFVRKLEDGLIELTFKEHISFELNDALEVDEVFRKFVGEKPYYTLVDGSSLFSSISEEARAHFAKPNDINIHRKAEALVAENFANRIIANLYMAINKPSNPVKVFSNKESALAWLKALKKAV